MTECLPLCHSPGNDIRNSTPTITAGTTHGKRDRSEGWRIGPPRGLAHCDETGCIRNELNIPSGERHELCRGIHAEQNAIIQSANYGTGISGSTIYTTHTPCSVCAKMIINAGILRVVSADDYPDELAAEMLRDAGIEVAVLEGGEG